MQISPLRLERHYFTRTVLISKSGDVDDVPNRIDCKLGFAVDSENRRRHKVSLKLLLEDEEGTRAPYSGEFEGVGYFAVAESWPDDQIARLVSVNCPSLLYGTVREMVLILSGRHEHGPVQLPTLRFPPMEEPRSKEHKGARNRRPVDHES